VRTHECDNTVLERVESRHRLTANLFGCGFDACAIFERLFGARASLLLGSVHIPSESCASLSCFLSKHFRSAASRRCRLCRFISRFSLSPILCMQFRAMFYLTSGCVRYARSRTLFHRLACGRQRARAWDTLRRKHLTTPKTITIKGTPMASTRYKLSRIYRTYCTRSLRAHAGSELRERERERPL
jgi:hypothetical protein